MRGIYWMCSWVKRETSLAHGIKCITYIWRLTFARPISLSLVLNTFTAEARIVYLLYPKHTETHTLSTLPVTQLHNFLFIPLEREWRFTFYTSVSRRATDWHLSVAWQICIMLKLPAGRTVRKGVILSATWHYHVSLALPLSKLKGAATRFITHIKLVADFRHKKYARWKTPREFLKATQFIHNRCAAVVVIFCIGLKIAQHQVLFNFWTAFEQALYFTDWTACEIDQEFAYPKCQRVPIGVFLRCRQQQCLVNLKIHTNNNKFALSASTTG